MADDVEVIVCPDCHEIHCIPKVKKDGLNYTFDDGGPELLLFIYVVGWLVDWGYWIAFGEPMEPGQSKSTRIALWAFFGMFVGLFWPLHAAVAMWQHMAVEES